MFDMFDLICLCIVSLLFIVPCGMRLWTCCGGFVGNLLACW